MDFDRLSQALSPELRAAVLLVGLIFVLGRIPILQFLILPFVVFGVVVHELAHALTSVLTGGQFGGLYVMYDTTKNYVTGGAKVRGGNDVLVTNAGYVGTLLFGALLLVVSASTVSARAVLLALGGLLLLATLLWIRGAFGMITSLLIAVGMILMSRNVPEIVAKGMLWILAVVMILDTFFDLVYVPQDATDLHKSTGIDFGFWIVLWFVLGGLFIVYALNRAYGVPLPWTLLGWGG